MKKLLFLFLALTAFSLTSYSQEYSMDSTYTTFTPDSAGGIRYYSKPYATIGNYQVTISAYVTADTLVGGVSLWVSNDNVRWTQWKASTHWPYSTALTGDTLVFANRTAAAATTAGAYIKHWVFPAAFYNYWRVSYYTGLTGTGAAVSGNLVTIRTRITLKNLARQ